MDYYDRSATFPPIDTYSVDWFGYYNPSVVNCHRKVNSFAIES